MILPGKEIRWKDFFAVLKREWAQDNVGDVAGNLAFSGVLALFPFLLFAVALAGMLIDPRHAETLVAQLERVAPPAVTDILGNQIRALTSSSKPGLLTISAVGAIWAASGGVVALMRAFNTAYDVRESRSFLKVRGLAIAVTLGGAVLVLLASALTIAAPPIAHALERSLGGWVSTLILWLRIPIAVLIMMLVLALLYYLLPDVEQEFRFITPGSIVAVIIWLAVSLGFSVYVTNFGKYDAMYGALGGIVVMLVWMWISAQVVLVGAEINAVIEHLSPEGKRAGAKSMAQRGADLPHALKDQVRDRGGAPELAHAQSPALAQAASEADRRGELDQPARFGRRTVVVRPRRRRRGLATGFALGAFGVGYLVGRRGP